MVLWKPLYGQNSQKVEMQNPKNGIELCPHPDFS